MCQLKRKKIIINILQALSGSAAFFTVLLMTLCAILGDDADQILYYTSACGVVALLVFIFSVCLDQAWRPSAATRPIAPIQTSDSRVKGS